METGATNRTAASQRAASVRKKAGEKPTEAATGEGFEESFGDMLIEEEDPEEQAKGRSSTLQQAGKVREKAAAEEREAIESSTSIWA
jgi:hypothetical protein